MRKVSIGRLSTKGSPGSEAFETEFSGNRRVDWVAPEPDSLLAGRLLGSKTALDLGWRANGDWAGGPWTGAARSATMADDENELLALLANGSIHGSDHERGRVGES